MWGEPRLAPSQLDYCPWRLLSWLLPRTIPLGLQVMGRGPFTDAETGCQTVIAGEAEMDAAIDTAESRFFGRR